MKTFDYNEELKIITDFKTYTRLVHNKVGEIWNLKKLDHLKKKVAWYGSMARYQQKDIMWCREILTTQVIKNWQGE